MTTYIFFGYIRVLTYETKPVIMWKIRWLARHFYILYDANIVWIPPEMIETMSITFNKCVLYVNLIINIVFTFLFRKTWCLYANNLNTLKKHLNVLLLSSISDRKKKRTFLIEFYSFYYSEWLLRMIFVNYVDLNSEKKA